MAQQQLFLTFIICMSLFIIVQMFSINNNPAEFQRYQRGFGNRRDLMNLLKYHYPKEVLFGFDNEENLRDDKHVLSIEENDRTHQHQQQLPPIIYR
jgi:Golgi nucleoside diphosphatase